MLTRAAERVADHAKRLIELELELAALEVRRKAADLGVGVGLLLATALVGVFGLAFALATVTAGLATVLPTWLALLIVTGGLLLVASVLAAIGLRKVRKGPPVPELALLEAKKTREALKNGAG
jgi:uncharacterized membrane protein YqgA involved in biofilm formation